MVVPDSSRAHGDDSSFRWWIALIDAAIVSICASMLAYVAALAAFPGYFPLFFPASFIGAYEGTHYIAAWFAFPLIELWLLWRLVGSRIGDPGAFLGFKPPSVGMISAAVMSAFVFGIPWLFAFVLDSWRGDALSDLEVFFQRTLLSPLGPLLVLLGVVAAPLAEEAMFRGYLLRTLSNTRFGFWGGALLSSALWAGTHWYDTAATIEIFVMGLALAWLARETRSIWLGIVVHGLTNATIFVVLASELVQT